MPINTGKEFVNMDGLDEQDVGLKYEGSFTVSNANIWLKDGAKYVGKYVATRSFKDKIVICSGKSIKAVFFAAKKKGTKDPVVFYVPEKHMAHIY
jgi:hypothetical protein